MTGKADPKKDAAPQEADKSDKSEKTLREQVEESPVTIAERSMPALPEAKNDLPEQTAYSD